jgi:hypothetical protein
LAGDWGLEPNRLLSFTLRQVYEYAKGIKKQRAIQENHIRQFAYLFASANRDSKKSFPSMSDFWPIPLIDGFKGQGFGSPEENEEIKQKLVKAWQLSQN